MISTQYITASEIVKTRCLRDEDVGLLKAHIYLSYMSAVYNDMRFDGTKKHTIKKFKVDKINNTVVIPNDCLMLVAVGYLDDCDRLFGMWYNESIPTEIQGYTQSKCDCDTCSQENTACTLVKEIETIEETIIINGVEYTKVIRTNILNDGRIIQYSSIPTLSDGEEGEEVVFIETEKLLCTLDTLPCGCIKNTPSNKSKIVENNCSCDINRCDNDSNSFRLDIQEKLIILPRNYQKDYVVLKYVSAITNAKDYLIPSIAMEAVLAGLKYYYETNNQSALAYTRGQNAMFHNMYKAEMNKLKKRLRPLMYDTILKALGKK